MYRLHGFCQSGNSSKVAFLLRALGAPCETVFVDFMNGRTRDASWRARLKALPGWGDPYEVLPGERIAPKWSS